MHLSSLKNMERFRDVFLSELVDRPLNILDLGSTEMGACYRPIFQGEKWRYVGADLAPGPNVDVVLDDPYLWKEIPSGTVDIFISGQVLEHVEFFWLTMLEISRVLKPGGLACIIVPSGGYEHRFPLDCWRFYPDGMRVLANFARLNTLDVYTQWEGIGDPGSDHWADSVLVARKPKRSFPASVAVRLLQFIQLKILSVKLVSNIPG